MRTLATRARAEAAPAVVMRTRTSGPVTPPAPAAVAAKASAARKPRAAGAGSTAKAAPAAAAPSSSRARRAADAGAAPSVPARSRPEARAAAGARPPGRPQRGKRATASSYYRVVGGVRYDRKVLEDCEASVDDDGVIDLGEARRIVADVLDGPRRAQGRGVVSAVTDCELATLRYAHERFEWTPEADAWVYGKLVEAFEAGRDARETKKTKAAAANADAEEEDAEKSAFVADSERREDASSEDDDGDGDDDDDDNDSYSSSDSSDSDSSDSDSDSSSSDSERSKDARPDWSAMDAATALAFARCAEAAAAKAAAAEAEKAGTLFRAATVDVAASLESFLRRERRAAAKFAARDAETAAAEKNATTAPALSFGVRSSSLGDASDSLFGGHVSYSGRRSKQNGDGLEPGIPAFSSSRGEKVDATPSRRAADARKKPKQLLLERDAKRRGKDGVRKTMDKNADALVSARALAEEGAGLFLKPLDTSKLRRDAKKLGGGGAADAANATKRWFSMPAVEYTPELRRDVRLLKLRGAYDPKRFYKTDDTSKLPKNFQIGTVVEGAQDFYSARLTKKERKRTLTEEVFADAEIKAVRKKRFAKIQAAKAHTMGRKEKRKLGGRARGPGGKPAAQKSTKRVKR